MGERRRLIVGLAIVAACAGGWLAAPRRFAVEGVSMGPALLPGDVVRTGVFPILDRLRQPRRFDRWVLTVEDELAVKRVVGLPGEEVSLAGGDLVIDGSVVLKDPRMLAETGSLVPDGPADAIAAEIGWSWSRPSGDVFDDAAFDGAATRVLSAVRDVGLAAVMDVRHVPGGEPAHVRVRVGDTVVTRPLVGPGRHAVVAGRLDGRLVVATWRIPPAAASTSRSCLPVAAPPAWDVVEPWPGHTDDDTAPALSISGATDRVNVADVSRWRDVAWRPGADGTCTWTLGGDDVLVLGDHPAASADSRRWGPIKAVALRYRLAVYHATRSRHEPMNMCLARDLLASDGQWVSHVDRAVRPRDRGAGRNGLGSARVFLSAEDCLPRL